MPSHQETHSLCRTLSNGRFLSACLSCGIGILSILTTPSADARTWVIPHVLERSGRVADTQFTFDTTVFATFNDSTEPGRDGKSAQVEIYIFDQTTGLPMEGSTGVVAAPAVFQLTSDRRNVAISVDDLITSDGGGFDVAVKLGFAVVVASGPQADAVNIQAVAVNSHTSAFDVSTFDLGAHLVPDISTNPAARTVVIPHVLETSGRISSDPFSFDTTIFATYVGGLAGVTNDQGATLDLYLYDQDGTPMLSATNAEICNPCSFELGTGGSGTPAPRKRSITIDSLIQDAGGFDVAAKIGFAVAVVGGADPDNVALHGFLQNAHSGAFDLSVFGFEPQPLQSGSAPRTIVLPHALEKSGTTVNTQFTFDTTIFATYSPGLAGTAPGPGANLDLYLFDTTGQPMTGSTSVVCQPCSFPLGDPGNGAVRKQSIRLDDLITQNGGGFDTGVKQGFAIAVVNGADPGGVNLQNIALNSHTSAFDVSMFGFEMLELPSGGSGAEASRAYVIPHVLERAGKTANTQFTFDTTIFATYSAGLAGVSNGNGADIKLYLYDRATGQFLSGNSGPVCAPCTFPMTAASPYASINIDNLIEDAGGFDVDVKTGSALIVIEGDAANVSLGGAINNAHTSAFDLSVFGFTPEPLHAARLSPFTLEISNVPDGLQLSLPTVIGYSYDLETIDNLTGSDWTPWTTIEGNGVRQFLPVPDDLAEQRYYRAIAH